MRLSVIVAAGMAAFLLARPPAAMAAAPEAASEQAAPAAPDVSWVDKLNRRTGVVALPQAGASLQLGERYYFLDAADSRKVLVDGWGNPPDAADGVLGIVFSAADGPLDDNAWGAVVTYQEDGYVSDKDAHKIDYGKLLKTLKAEADASNDERKRQGYETVSLLGWAQQPTYDATRHTLVWARELKFGETPHNTLNYDIRVLGRKGVLSLNIVGAMSDLEAVRAGSASFAKTAAFDEGRRYADFIPGEDRVAAYGIAGLIGVGAAAAAAKNAGLLAGLLLVLKKGAVFIVAGGAAALAWLRRLFGRKD